MSPARPPTLRSAATFGRSLSARWPLWLSRFLEEASWSLLLLALLVTAWRLQPDPRVAGGVVAGWFLLRPAMPWIVGRLQPLAVYAACVMALGLLAVALRLGALDQVLLLVLGAAALGGIRSIGIATRASMLGQLAHADAPAAAGAVDALTARLGMAAGATLAALVLLAPGAAVWWLLYAVLVAGAFGLALLARRAGSDQAHANGPSLADARRPEGLPPTTATFRPLALARPSSYLVAAFGTGALSGALVAQLPQLIVRGALDPAITGAALALVAAGGFARVPLARARLRIPPVLLISLLVWATAAAVALVGLVGSVLVLAPLLLVVGSLSATMDRQQLLGLRRAGPGTGRSRRLLVVLAVGQLVGSLSVVLLGADPAALGGPLVVVAAATAALMAIGLLLDHRSLFVLRAQVQQFSWNANPAPRRYEPAPPDTRRARLEGWVGRQVELELVDVRLPVSGRQYAIARPSGVGRDRLFEEAKADPERQMPYWAKVWPSGVALADVVVERADEVRQRQVLELGAGLGVTACTVLEEGGRLITADYSLLPLALCRLNGLGNTGRGVGSICFNWRDEEQVGEVLRRHPPIGLILAADVLYEGRDVIPLVHVIERLLAPDGSLWLAEPVRRTAQRFLDSVAARGWCIDSRTIAAEWPDATDGRVNVHIIGREREPHEAAVGLGGWQI